MNLFFNNNNKNTRCPIVRLFQLLFFFFYFVNEMFAQLKSMNVSFVCVDFLFNFWKGKKKSWHLAGVRCKYLKFDLFICLLFLLKRGDHLTFDWVLFFFGKFYNFASAWLQLNFQFNAMDQYTVCMETEP